MQLHLKCVCFNIPKYIFSESRKISSLHTVLSNGSYKKMHVCLCTYIETHIIYACISLSVYICMKSFIYFHFVKILHIGAHNFVTQGFKSVDSSLVIPIHQIQAGCEDLLSVKWSKSLKSIQGTVFALSN